MVTFEVNDMTCGHCVSSITKAIRAVDHGAQVQFDLATHRVLIEPTNSDAGTLAQAITQAGYSPVETTSTPLAHGMTAPRSTCCCR